MKKPCLLLSAVLGVAASARDAAEPAAGEAAVTAVAEVPSDANLSQEQAAGDAVQMRWRSLSNGGKSDNRGAVQSFRWEVSAPMTGIGFGVDAARGDAAPLPGPQPYRLDLHEVDPQTARTLSVRRIAGFTLDLTPELLAGEGGRSFLYLTFPEPVSLDEGVTYAAHLRPGEGDELSFHRVFLLRSAEDDPYSGGVGNQTDASARADGDPFGSRRYDLVFFTTAGAEEPR